MPNAQLGALPFSFGRQGLEQIIVKSMLGYLGAL